MFEMRGKVALISGCTGYLGREVAHGLAKAGVLVYVNGRSADKVQALVGEIEARGYAAMPAIFDVGIEEEVNAFFGGFQESSLDILINNAYSGGGGTVKTASRDEYLKAYDISVISAHTLFRAALPLLTEAKKNNGDSSVINIASMYGVVSPDIGIYQTAGGSNPPFYAAAKAALIQWTKYAACEFAEIGIRVNSISPGPFPSKQVQAVEAELVEQLEKKTPMGRIGQPEELVGPVLFLSSGMSTYVTGTNLIVDGGWTAW